MIISEIRPTMPSEICLGISLEIPLEISSKVSLRISLSILKKKTLNFHTKNSKVRLRKSRRIASKINP